MASPALAAIDRVLVPADDARRRVMRALLRVPSLSRVLADKDRRIAAVATTGIVFALLATTFAPILLFAISPVLLGVPHVASDVRYLVLRRALPAWWKWAIAVACVSLVGLRVAYEVALSGAEDVPERLMQIEIGIAGAWIVLAGAAGALVRATRALEDGPAVGTMVRRTFAAALGSGAIHRLAIVGPITVALAALAWQSPYYTMLGITHGHNLVGVVLWLVVFRRSVRAVLVPLVVFAATTALLLSGELLPLAAWSGGLVGFGADLAEVSVWLAPGLSARVALAVTMAYLFLQAVHYSVWLGWIPQEETRAEGTLTFRMSARSLLSDFGTWGVIAIVLGVATVIGFATTNLLRTRDVYLSVAAFHGYLELAMLAFLLTSGRASTSAEPTAP